MSIASAIESDEIKKEVFLELFVKKMSEDINKNL
jgi:hypothetical protein